MPETTHRTELVTLLRRALDTMKRNNYIDIKDNNEVGCKRGVFTGRAGAGNWIALDTTDAARDSHKTVALSQRAAESMSTKEQGR